MIDNQSSSHPALRRMVSVGEVSIAHLKSACTAMALWNYRAQNNDELPLQRGEVVEILDPQVFDGWMKGKNSNGNTGLFPDNYVRILPKDAPVTQPQRPTGLHAALSIPQMHIQHQQQGQISVIRKPFDDYVYLGKNDTFEQIAQAQDLKMNLGSADNASEHSNVKSPSPQNANTPHKNIHIIPAHEYPHSPPSPSDSERSDRHERRLSVASTESGKSSQSTESGKMSGRSTPTAPPACITQSLKSFEYKKSGPLDRVVDVTSAIEMLKPQGLGQTEWFHFFTSLTQINDLLRNPMQHESELKVTLLALINSINGKANRGRLRFQAKITRKESLLKATKELISIEVSVDHNLASPDDATIHRSILVSYEEQKEKISLQSALIDSLQDELKRAEASSSKNDRRGSEEIEIDMLRAQVASLHEHLTEREREKNAAESQKAQMKRLLAKNADLNDTMKDLQSELAATKVVALRVPMLESEVNSMNEKLAAMDKGRSMLVKRVEELTGLLATKNSVEPALDMTEEIGHLRAQLAEEQANQVATSERVRALERALRAELKSTAELNIKVSKLMHERDELCVALERGNGQ